MRRLLLVLAALAVSPLASAQKAPDSYPGGVYNATPFTLADKQTSTLQFDTNGNLKVVSSGGGGGGTVQGMGTAGTPSGGLLTVQGAVGMTPLIITDSNSYAQGSATSGQLGGLMQGAVTSGIPAYVTGQTSPLSLSTAGALRIVPTGLGGNAVYGNMSAGVSPVGGAAGVAGIFLSTPPALTNGQAIGIQLDASGDLLTGSRPLTPVVSASAEATHVLKGTPGNLLTAHASNLSVTPGLLVIINATSAPADGSLTGVLACRNLPANGEADIALGVPTVASTGITAILTSATSCFTKTTGVITGFISGNVQ